MFGATDNLSRAASGVYRVELYAHHDYDMDGSGELGDRIARSHNNAKLALVRQAGFTPAEYNAELRRRLAPQYPRMSHSTYSWLQILEVEDEETFHDNHTFVETYPGELSSLAFLKNA